MSPARLALVAVETDRPAYSELLEQVHALGRDVIAPAAEAVDRDARFPIEAFEGLKSLRLLSAYIPPEFGGLGLDMTEIAGLCEALGRYCASTAMIFAMHQIQVACIVHHALGTAFFRDYAREIAREQRLLASATTELGIGGDVRQSICCAKVVDDHFILEKQAPVISYGEVADAILVTCRRAEDAARSDQVLVLVRKEDCLLRRLSEWDTLGFRGTCSCGWDLSVGGDASWILPEPFEVIAARTMLPTSHILWASLWLGIATDAVRRARAAVRAEARTHPDRMPTAARRVAELTATLQALEALVHDAVAHYERCLDDEDALGGMPFALRMNNLKTVASTMLVHIVSEAMVATGLGGYRRDSATSVERHLRDAFGAPIMVGNDRITGNSAAMLTVMKDG